MNQKTSPVFVTGEVFCCPSFSIEQFFKPVQIIILADDDEHVGILDIDRRIGADDDVSPPLDGNDAHTIFSSDVEVEQRLSRQLFSGVYLHDGMLIGKLEVIEYR